MSSSTVRRVLTSAMISQLSRLRDRARDPATAREGWRKSTIEEADPATGERVSVPTSSPPIAQLPCNYRMSYACEVRGGVLYHHLAVGVVVEHRYHPPNVDVVRAIAQLFGFPNDTALEVMEPATHVLHLDAPLDPTQAVRVSPSVDYGALT